MTPLLTIFAAPKPFTNPHIALIQRNAIRSWLALGDEVQVILLGEETGLVETAVELGVLHIPEVERNASGTPLVSSMFTLARQASQSPYLGCINADIVLTPGVLTATQTLGSQAQRFLMVGQRWDLAVTEPLDFGEGWANALTSRAQSEGTLHRASGSDYFIFPRDCYTSMPRFAIGRAGWDNWMIFHGRWEHFPVVDASPDVTIIHQNHDYSHLPGGQPHYRLPETFENVRLAGGKRAILELSDATHTLQNGKLKPRPLSWQRFWREIELFPLTRLHSFPLAWAAFALFHPYKAYAAWRNRHQV
ncbi:MAG TPA: hypothetical protein VIO61_03085 [Anaerolineaceae bacterium]